VSEKNHYIPIFYQRRWAVDKKNVYIYFKNPRCADVRKGSPSSIGYEIDLYTAKDVDSFSATYLEREFFGITDDLAGRALASIERGPWPMNIVTRSGWGRFVVSLLMRNPEQIGRFNETVSRYMRAAKSLYEKEYHLRKDVDHPPTFEEFWEQLRPEVMSRTWINLVQTTIDDKVVGNYFINLRWRVFDFHGANTLLTGDRPIVMTNGMVNPDSHLALPIGPRKLFVAATEERFLDSIRTDNSDALVEVINDLIVRQARRFCIGVDQSHLDFFAARFGEKRPSSPVEEVPLPSEEELRTLYLTSENENDS
jgi:hypothetical protein